MSMMEARLPDLDKALESEKDVLETVTPAGDLQDRSSNTIMSILSSPHKLSSLFSQEARTLSQPVTIIDEQSRTVSTLTKIPVQISLPALTNLTIPASVTNFMGDIESVTNSTPYFLGSTNVTMLESTSSWTAEEVGAVILVSLMVPFILLSNIFVIVCVVRFRRLHTPTNYFISSLAAVDIFVAMVTPFGVVVEVFNFSSGTGSGDVVFCLLPNRILMMACGVSVLTLANIAYDRYTALVSPLEYVNIMTSRKVGIMVSLTWIYSAVIVWLPLMAGWYDAPTDTDPCSANLIHGKAPLLFLSAIFVPSCVAIFVCYFRIFLVARHHAKAIATMESAVHRRLQVKFLIKDTKYAKTLALVIGVFLVLWLPYLIFIFVKTVSSVKFNIWVQTYLTLLTVFNSGINPWIYAFKNNELKAAFKRIVREFCRDKLCKNVHRRGSLVSAVSGTPRLSRTDSRMASIVPEVTVDSVSEKLKRSLASLDGCEHDNILHVYDNRACHETIADEISPFSPQVCLKAPLRQAASCSNLNPANTAQIKDLMSKRKTRSFSVDFGVLDESSGQTDLDEGGENIAHLYRQLDHPSGHVPTESVNHAPTEAKYNIFSSSTKRATKTHHTTSTSLSSASSRYIPPPPPSSSSRRPSLSPSQHPSSSSRRPSLSPSQPPSSSSRRPSLSPSQTSTLSLGQSSGESNHQHSSVSQIITPTHQPSFFITATSPQHHPHTQSLNCPKIALQSDVLSWRDSQYQDVSLHPNFPLSHAPTATCPDVTQSREPHPLSHTQSCPIFEPVTAYQLLFPQIWEHDGSSYSHQRKVTPYRLENCLDFVSLVHKEAEDSHTGRYLV